MSRITDLMQKRTATVIEGLPVEFSTRQFIWKFADDYEGDYIEMLLYAYKNEATRIFHSLHAQIGSYLLDHSNELNITKLDRREVDINPFGRKSESQVWEKY